MTLLPCCGGAKTSSRGDRLKTINDKRAAAAAAAGAAPAALRRGRLERREPSLPVGMFASHLAEPESTNDYERVRLDNIRRNQAALAALMGRSEAQAPAAAPAE